MEHDKAQSIAVLGSTGSIGRQTLEVAAFLGLNVVALAVAGGNIALLHEQIKLFLPHVVAVADSRAAVELSRMLDNDSQFGAAPDGKRPEILHGSDGICAAAAQSGAKTVVAAISGAAGLPAVMSAIKAGKVIALANKETLVMAGKLVMELSRVHCVPILPVDGEHSAIFQCLRGAHSGNEVKRLILTASGGPFRNYIDSSFETITPEQAAAHPVWAMGRKISIDSSTLSNKGLEVIEASSLFGLGPEAIDVLIHPQSVIHSMVEFCDNSVMALMGASDMRAPIQYALTYPARRESLAKAVDFARVGCLTFEEPDIKRFPCLPLAYEALRAGGTMPAVYNAANEAAVSLFIDKAAKYSDIPVFIERAMERHTPVDDMDIGNIYEADREARETVYHLSQKATYGRIRENKKGLNV